MSLKDRLDPNAENRAAPFDVVLTPHVHAKVPTCGFWAHSSIMEEVYLIIDIAGDDADQAAAVLRAEGLNVVIMPWTELNVAVDKLIGEMEKKDKES